MGAGIVHSVLASLAWARPVPVASEAGVEVSFRFGFEQPEPMVGVGDAVV